MKIIKKAELELCGDSYILGKIGKHFILNKTIAGVVILLTCFK